MDVQTDGRQADFSTKLIYPFFLKKKAGIIKHNDWQPIILLYFEFEKVCKFYNLEGRLLLMNL